MISDKIETLNELCRLLSDEQRALRERALNAECHQTALALHNRADGVGRSLDIVRILLHDAGVQHRNES